MTHYTLTFEDNWDGAVKQKVDFALKDRQRVSAHSSQGSLNVYVYEETSKYDELLVAVFTGVATLETDIFEYELTVMEPNKPEKTMSEAFCDHDEEEVEKLLVTNTATGDTEAKWVNREG